MTQPDRPPFSRLYAVSELRDTGHEIVLTANQDERAALAKANGLVGVASMEAAFRIHKRGRSGLSVKGQVQARVTQTCVVSLEPFDVDIVEAIDARFEPQNTRAPIALHEAETFASLPDADPPDPIVDGRVDLGALAGEHLSLGLDPYPRKPGAVFEAAGAEPEDDSPFARLKQALATKGNKN